jgi:uncharacterized protein (TIGR03437 family)
MKYCRHLLITVSILSCVPVTHAQVILNPSATRAIGAARLEQLGSITNAQPNLVEGRELNGPEGVALDLSVKPPHLYIADTGNNRVLGWKDATTFANGAFADIVIGQNDLFTTLPQGPGRAGSTLPSSGMTAPMGMVVDAGGNLYVIDAGNNRILRFPAPFNQTGGQLPNMVIGQQNFLSNAPNAGGVGANTLAFTNGTSIFQAYMKFDSSGNLWVADVVNQRVLEYQASDLANGKNGPNAVLVLGQPDFTTNSLTTPYDATSTSVLNFPTGIAFDQSGGRLYVSESQPGAATTVIRSRVLVFQPPYASNKPAQRIIGTVTATNPVQPPTISAEQFASGAGDVFAINDNISVADANNNRVLVFPPFQQYTSDTLTQNAQVVIGQADFNSGKANQGNADANSNTLQLPVDAAFAPGSESPSPDTSGEVYIADAGNNRVLVIPVIPNSSTLGFNSAVRLLGQKQFSEQAPNYIEGREFHFSDNSGAADAGIALDTNANPPHLYVADTYNNRILCYVDYRTVTTGSTATFVIGQPDLFHADVNYPSGTANTVNQGGLNHPTGLAVDPATGNLYVADTGNGRVLRFPAPFLQPSNVNQTPDIVLGQANFTTKITDVSASRMAAPYGIAFVQGVGLLVADVLDNRILLFPGTNFTSGMAATKVWGQSGFTTAVSGGANVDNRFNSPHGIAVDSGQRLYVVDSGNNRVVVFDNIVVAGTDPHSIISVAGLVGGALSQPRSIYITPPGNPLVAADQIWIGDGSRALRFSGGYTSLFTSGTNGFAPDEVIPEAGALALAVDGYGALYVADDINRVVVHYIGLSAVNGASYISSNIRDYLAPNTIVSLFSEGGTFGAGTQSFSTLPLPTNMQAIQVQMNGTPLPLYFVSPAQINFLIPNNAPTSGTADLQVVRTDNGQVLGDSTITMSTQAPGVFAADGSGKGQIAALNQDYTPNSSSNPIARGNVLQVYGTGVGFIPGAPNDGSAVATATPSPQTATAYINGIQCPVQYSGLAPELVGVWQINISISQNVVPTSSAPGHISELIVFQNGTPASSAALYGIQDTVWVK